MCYSGKCPWEQSNGDCSLKSGEKCKFNINNLEMKNLNITVSGEVTNGTSYLVYQIRKLLSENGFIVNHDYDSNENQTECNLDRVSVDNLDEKIETLKTETIITINEKQLPRK